MGWPGRAGPGRTGRKMTGCEAGQTPTKMLASTYPHRMGPLTSARLCRHMWRAMCNYK